MAVIRRGRHSLLALGLASAVLLLSACGAGGSGAPTSDSAAPAAAKDDALAKLVPADIAADGKIVVGSDASYPPSEFVDTDGRTIIGLDADLGKAIAQKLGLTAEFQNSQFDGILPGLNAGKYEWGMSSFFINPERLKSVDMVSYFNAGTKLGSLKGNPENLNVDDLCGRNIGVQLGTAQVQELSERSAKCTTEGKPAINVTSLQQQTDVTLALTAHRISGMLADSAVVSYAETTTDGAVATVGQQYGTTPYGIAIAKGKGDFGKAIQGAVQALIADGTYATILKKWNLSDGALATSQWEK
ncbi:ABC transporter substrate-binding protein [Pseudonocardia spinosispora]|uniref:ABC transporter substrate-binding protein n=1 Tax=Pseudonocardia spinosispora TaxID=103441 RepID=UPI000406902A|nr:ABC transporter substrate-binding protein [Pseudonocardia spinosispora]